MKSKSNKIKKQTKAFYFGVRISASEAIKLAAIRKHYALKSDSEAMRNLVNLMHLELYGNSDTSLLKSNLKLKDWQIKLSSSNGLG